MSEPKFPNQNLNPATVDVITARIDAYDQAWEKRMDGLFKAVERIATWVEEIRDFIGTSAEQQKTVELRIVNLEVTVIVGQAAA